MGDCALTVDCPEAPADLPAGASFVRARQSFRLVHGSRIWPPGPISRPNDVVGIDFDTIRNGLTGQSALRGPRAGRQTLTRYGRRAVRKAGNGPCGCAENVGAACVMRDFAAQWPQRGLSATPPGKGRHPGQNRALFVDRQSALGKLAMRRRRSGESHHLRSGSPRVRKFFAGNRGIPVARAQRNKTWTHKMTIGGQDE